MDSWPSGFWIVSIQNIADRLIALALRRINGMLTIPPVGSGGGADGAVGDGCGVGATILVPLIPPIGFELTKRISVLIIFL